MCAGGRRLRDAVRVDFIWFHFFLVSRLEKCSGKNGLAKLKLPYFVGKNSLDPNFENRL
jgi:hypothetical protein